MDRKELVARIDNYLGNGGLFNPEAMEHDKVRQLLMDCREVLLASDQTIDRQNDRITTLSYVAYPARNASGE